MMNFRLQPTIEYCFCLNCCQLHKKVTLSRHHKFKSWVQSWIERSATSSSVEACTDLLLGRGEYSAEFVPCSTQEQTIADENSTPYYPYSKYHVTYPDKDTAKNQ